MRRIFLVIILVSVIPAILFGQLKKDLKKPEITTVLSQPSMQNGWFSFIDPSKLDMRHSVSMSYMTLGGQNVMLNSYMNTIDYRFNDKLSITTNIGIMSSPYNSLPVNSPLNEQQIFGGAQLRYQFSENSLIMFEFQSLPYYYNHNQFSPYRGGWPYHNNFRD